MDTHWRELGIPNPNLFLALAVYLGTPTRDTAFFVARRLNELGMPMGGPRLALFVPRGGMNGLFLWITPVGSRETSEETSMKRVLGTQGYDCMTVYDSTSGARTISEYMGQTDSSRAGT